MRQNIARVLAAFDAGEVATDETCSTDGETLYSYDMPIAWYEGGEIAIVARSQAPSRTTRSQVAACEQYFSDRRVRIAA